MEGQRHEEEIREWINHRRGCCVLYGWGCSGAYPDRQAWQAGIGWRHLPAGSEAVKERQPALKNGGLRGDGGLRIGPREALFTWTPSRNMPVGPPWTLKNRRSSDHHALLHQDKRLIATNHQGVSPVADRMTSCVLASDRDKRNPPVDWRTSRPKYVFRTCSKIVFIRVGLPPTPQAAQCILHENRPPRVMLPSVPLLSQCHEPPWADRPRRVPFRLGAIR